MSYHTIPYLVGTEEMLESICTGHGLMAREALGRLVSPELHDDCRQARKVPGGLAVRCGSVVDRMQYVAYSI